MCLHLDITSSVPTFISLNKQQVKHFVVVAYRYAMMVFTNCW
ncbi:hypothetical protein HORM4_260080 [Vibrio harveyi]|nr:hypothetical protein HORM4_260080 [Vibrio harveyi]